MCEPEGVEQTGWLRASGDSQRKVSVGSEDTQFPPRRSLCSIANVFLSFLPMPASTHSAPTICEQGPGHTLCGGGGRTDHLHCGRCSIPSDQVRPGLQLLSHGAACSPKPGRWYTAADHWKVGLMGSRLLLDTGPPVAGKTWLNTGFQEGNLLSIPDLGWTGRASKHGRLVWRCPECPEGSMKVALVGHSLTGPPGWFQVVQGWRPANPWQQVPDAE